MDYKLLGERFHEERTKLRMTQAELAEAINMSISFVGEVERTDKKLSLETLVRIANTLAINIDLLLKYSVHFDHDNLHDEVNRYLERLNKQEKLYVLNMIKTFYEYHERSKN